MNDQLPPAEPPEAGDIISFENLPDGARFGKAKTWLPSLTVVEYQTIIAALQEKLEAAEGREARLRERVRELGGS